MTSICQTWSKLKPVHKITYIAQLATVFSFLTATGFSFLSWREARWAREEQKQFFAAEKAPNILVTGAYLSLGKYLKNPELKLALKNVGLSTAKNLGVVVQRPDQKILYNSINDPNTFSLLQTFTLLKDATLTWPVGRKGDLFEVEGDIVSLSVEAPAYKEFSPEKDELPLLFVTVTWSDNFDNFGFYKGVIMAKFADPKPLGASDIK